MCYQISELYSACRCLYYQHPIDRCALYGRSGHSIQRRSILIGYSCTEHAHEPWFIRDYRGPQPDYLDTDYHSENSKAWRWSVAAEPVKRKQLVAPPKIVALKPFDFESWIVYLYSFEPPSENLIGSPGQLKYPLSAHGPCLLPIYCPSNIPSQGSDTTYDPTLPGVGLTGSAATKSSFVPTPRPASLFSEPNGSSTDMSDRESWPDTDTLDSSDQASIIQSESSDVLQEDHYLNDLRQETIDTVLSSFYALQRGSQTSREPNRLPGIGSSSDPQNNSPNRSTRKRARSDANSKESSPLNGPQIFKKQRPEPERDLLFACPFFKKDPLRHRPCEKSGQKRIRDVKQHLRRKHFDPFYCSRCWIIFDSEQQRDEHTRALFCELRPDEVREQLSLTQVMALNKKVDHKLTSTVQWFSVWDICFPGQPRPASPYIDPELSEQLSSFHVYYIDHGPDIIYAALSSNNMLNCQLPNAERDVSAFRRSVLSGVLERIYESWVDSRRPSQARTSAFTSVSISGSEGIRTEFNETLSAMNSQAGDHSNYNSDRGILGDQSQLEGLQGSSTGVGSLFDFTADPFCLSDEHFDFGSLAGDYGNGFEQL